MVQSKEFRRYQAIGNVLTAVEFFNAWAVDEIILLDINATVQKRLPHLKVVEEISKKCFVPLTVGGGIRTIEDVRQTLKAGADKVSINSFAIKQPEFIGEVAEVYGRQCVVVSIDVQLLVDGSYEVFRKSGSIATGLRPDRWAFIAEEQGAGEIFLNSIDRDGSKNGYDLQLIKLIVDTVNIPVIACGGVGHWQHFVDGIIHGDASAVSAANILHYTEHSTQKAKAYMIEAGIDMRREASWH